MIRTDARRPLQARWAYFSRLPVLVFIALAAGGAGHARVLAQSPATPELSAARNAVLHGRYAEALTSLQNQARQAPLGDAALELGLLQVTLGRRADAERTLEPLDVAAMGARDPQMLGRAARASHALGRFQDANAYFRRAVAMAPDDPALNTAWGQLFLDKYNRQDAVKSFQAALRVNGNFVPAQIAMARAAADENPPAALKLAERALTLDPASVPAHLLIADLQLDQGHRPEATQAIARALEINPSSLPAHALLAAIANLEGRKADFDREVAKALAINPNYGEIYRVAGDLAARNYRFEEAVALTRQAITLDPDNARASADIGVHLLRTGDEPAAREALDRAFAADPYDVVTYNLLGLLDTLTKFETIRDDTFEMRLHPDEAPVMREYALPLAHLALAALSARYEFQPKGSILIEMFPRHDDFAVRNVGLPGMIGALGACFGRVITLDSPRARPPGTFNWGATLWHEMAHVITLQLSKQRVPRWLTEGISVYEEKRARPEWGREMEIPFAEALNRGEVLKLRDLNAGFTNPATISLAYFEASLLVEHMVGTYGEPALHKLLRAYGDGLETEAALKSALNVDIDSLQASFDRMIDAGFGGLARAMRAPDGLAGSPITRLRSLRAASPESYPVLIALAQALRRAGDVDEAMQTLEKASAIVPMATGPDSPHALLAEIALERGDKARAIAEFGKLLEHDHTDIESARRLAAMLDPAADPDRAGPVFERIVAIDPFDTVSHAVLGRIALARRDAETAAREFRVALATGPADLASAHCDLAESYLLAGRASDAKKQTLAALEIAPAYPRAQELLLKLSEGGA